MSDFVALHLIVILPDINRHVCGGVLGLPPGEGEM